MVSSISVVVIRLIVRLIVLLLSEKKVRIIGGINNKFVLVLFVLICCVFKGVVLFLLLGLNFLLNCCVIIGF